MTIYVNVIKFIAQVYVIFELDFPTDEERKKMPIMPSMDYLEQKY